ncbi:MAG TPA: molybdenum cofactor guanylyltransferase [Solirubrobacteraceae bacterium]|nr:molybdenum cofactor guanylyltransferase [Solirubrobacteraceae bacterium]
MHEAAAIVLAGGRSTRMGSSKAALDWHGSTLLWRVSAILARSVDGPVVVVRAADQGLPELPSTVEVATDANADRGPLEGLAAGLRLLAGDARLVYASATDVPLLHPAFVRRVIGAVREEDDIALPEVGGHHQPLAAAYRRDILSTLEDLIAADELRPASLYARCRVRRLSAEELLGDESLARLDPHLDSLRNLNDRADYERACARPGPAIMVKRGSAEPGVVVNAWSLGEAAPSLGVTVSLNGDPVPAEAQLPLVEGDVVAF